MNDNFLINAYHACGGILYGENENKNLLVNWIKLEFTWIKL